MYFRDENGEPRLMKHNGDPNKDGQVLEKQGLLEFAIDSLVKEFLDLGMKIREINKIDDFEYPNFIMETKGGIVYYVIVKTTMYSQDPNIFNREDFHRLTELANQNHAIPVYAGVLLACVDNCQFDEPISGGYYLLSFKGLFGLSDLPIK